MEGNSTAKKRSVAPKGAQKAAGLTLFVIVVAAMTSFGTALLLSTTSTGSQITKTLKTLIVEESSIINVAQDVSPSVVSISAKSLQRDFFGRIRTATSSGTGFVATQDGLIITNKHVVSESG